MKYIYKHESFGDFVELAKKDAPDYEGQRESREAGGDWYGTGTFDKALELAETGWQAGAKRVKELSTAISEQLLPQIDRVSTYYDVAGGFVDIGRYLGGDVECMVNFDTERGTGHKVIKVASNYMFNSNWSGKEIENRGAVVLALVDALEQAGVSVELDVLGVNKGWGVDVMVDAITVKRAGEAMDIDKLAYAMVNPAFFRRITFSRWETLPNEQRAKFNVRAGGGYGRSCNETHEWEQHIPDVIKDYDVAYGSDAIEKHILTGSDEGRERAIKWIKKELTKLGVVLA